MAARARRRNILFIQTDQHQRAMLGCYGHPTLQTPNLDRLAQNGLRFTQAYTCTGVCTPARGALLSGRYPHNSGMFNNPENFWGAGPRLCQYTAKITPFSGPLIAAGYDCTHIGKWHIGGWFDCKPADYGFRGPFYPGYGYPYNHPHYNRYLKTFGLDGLRLSPSKFGKAMQRYINEHRAPAEASIPGYLASQTVRAVQRAARSENPFFISMDFWGPHVPVNIPPEYLYMYSPDEAGLPQSWRDFGPGRPAINTKMHNLWGGDHLTEKRVRQIRAAYMGYVTLIDHQIGRVLAELEKRGLADSTTVIFSSDHGSTLSAHGLQDKGCNMYDEVYRIPLIISGAGVQTPGKTVDKFVYNIDLAPTFIELAGRRVPENYDFSPLTPYLRGDLKHTIRKDIFMEAYGHQVPYIQRAVRDRKYKYIFNAAERDEFYDIQSDPAEMHNLIDAADTKLIRKYQKRLLKWMTDTGDAMRGFTNASLTQGMPVPLKQA